MADSLLDLCDFLTECMILYKLMMSNVQGANTACFDRLGNTPLDDAKREGHHSTAQILESTSGLDFSQLDPMDPIDNGFRSLMVTQDGVVTFQHVIDSLTECGILIDDPRIRYHSLNLFLYILKYMVTQVLLAVDFISVILRTKWQSDFDVLKSIPNLDLLL